MKKYIIFFLSSFLIVYFIKTSNCYSLNNIVDYNNDNYTLITKILKDANKNSLLSYTDLISLQTVNCIPNDINNTIAYIISLPQQTSFLALYTYDKNNNLNFNGIIDNLSNIENFYYYKDFIVIEQSDSKSANNFTQRNFVEIFYKKNNNYISVFNKNIYCEKVINNNNVVSKKVEISSIDYLEGDLPRIICINTTTIYKGIFINLSNSYEYKEESKSTSKEIYEWSNDIECFSIKKEL